MYIIKKIGCMQTTIIFKCRVIFNNWSNYAHMTTFSAPIKLEYMNSSDANILIASSEVLRGKEVKFEGDVDYVLDKAAKSFLGTVK